jgi:hypothetical protein
MKKTLLTLLLLSLALTGCIVDPYGGNRHRGDAERGEFHSDRDHNGNWAERGEHNGGWNR